MKRGILLISLLLILILSGCVLLGPRGRSCDVDRVLDFMIKNPDADLGFIKKELSSRKYNCKALVENSVKLASEGIRERARNLDGDDVQFASECAVVGNLDEVDGAEYCVDDPDTEEVEGYNLVATDEVINVQDVVIVANSAENSCYLDLGDMNGDGLINILDIVIGINYVIESGIDLTPAQLCALDINQDGIHNVLDIVAIIHMILEEDRGSRLDTAMSTKWYIPECGHECIDHSECNTGYYCHSGWNGERYGPRFCVEYTEDYCYYNPCGLGDGDCDPGNGGWAFDYYEGSPGCQWSVLCGINNNLNNCNFGNGITSDADCCIGVEPNYNECGNFYDSCSVMPVQIVLNHNGGEDIQGVQIDICPDPFHPTEDYYEILNEGITAFNDWMWRVEVDGEPTDVALPCSCASMTGQCTRLVGLAITLDDSKYIQSGVQELSMIQLNIQNSNFPINVESGYQSVGIAGVLTTNTGQQISTTFNGLSETLCGDLGFTCGEDSVSVWNIPDEFIEWFGEWLGDTECSEYNQGDTVDCSGVVNGVAYEDNCETCDSDPSNDCVVDCTDEWGGEGILDICGTCDNDPSNDCVQDCAGVWGGDSYEDDCGVCDFVPENDC